MSNETNTSGRSRTWPRRRILGTALGLAVVVGTGAAAANASAHGDGFLKQDANHMAAPRVAATSATNGYNHQGGNPSMSGSGGMSADPSWSAGNGNTDGDRMANTWTWSGWGANRWALRSINNPADPTFNQLLGINNRGVIVGYYGSGKDDMHPNKGFWVGSPYNRHDFRDENFPGSVQTQVIGINDDGTTVGFYVKRDGSNHGFVRWHGQFKTVDFPHTTSSPSFNQLLGISRNGIAAGVWNDAAGHSHGYLFNTNTHRFTPIRLPWGATSVTVTGVNDNGTVVGFAMIGKVTVAFVITPHKAVVVKLGNGTNTQALGVNRFGMVVGSFVDRNDRTHGFVWSDGKVRTVDFPHSKSTVVNGLNDRNQIVGFFEDSMGNTKGFLAKQ